MAEPDLAGMTVNERLFALGLLEQFDAAREQSDLLSMRRLLERVEVDEASIVVMLGGASDSR
ncbi:hypothetical protein P1X14_14635 [Sphingomonas sp. AOB5]|uniref:hypothetical protein n=1 Tax=Sphingomonas sp. AOB5 TaxID=3034017 RepID=UPI0023F7C542|nr:hypothetical protein [Sphingomonas sp. AOB5]MDF7776489.1 hypothetical protein [Sphingomonas sp. AOB5]